MIYLVRTATEMVHRLPEMDTATLTTRDVLAWNVVGELEAAAWIL